MKCLRPAEVAKRLEISKAQVWKLLRKGKLRRIKVSARLTLVDADSLREVFGEAIIRARFPELYADPHGEVSCDE
ncbi:MAG: helix-turn-helix domain-containing protein [Fimbriimonadales bacterium]|nr:helix-turn-helix domain-containing protein [Fimbriimonadales bacterium]